MRMSMLMGHFLGVIYAAAAAETVHVAPPPVDGAIVLAQWDGRK